jgi:hypothetical protein
MYVCIAVFRHEWMTQFGFELAKLQSQIPCAEMDQVEREKYHMNGKKYLFYALFLEDLDQESKFLRPQLSTYHVPEMGMHQASYGSRKGFCSAN